LATPGCHLGLFTFNPYGVVLFNLLATPGCHLGLFTFNPYGVVLFNLLATPGCHLGLFTFNPYGVVLFNLFLIDLPLYFMPSGKFVLYAIGKAFKSLNCARVQYSRGEPGAFPKNIITFG